MEGRAKRQVKSNLMQGIRRKRLVKGLYFTKGESTQYIKKLSTMKKAIKEGYKVRPLNNDAVLRAQTKQELFP